MADTIFSKIIKREIPAAIVFEDDELLAFKDINPQAPVHILIIPKKPVPSVNDLSDSDAMLIGKIVLRAKELAKEFGIAESGYRLVFNCNSDGGQEVYHLHCHLIGGKKLKWLF
jgi:histidine triad (HIT) family protein